MKILVVFDFEQAFGCPVKVMNDASMQALGSYEKGKMLFLGLGTGLGSSVVVNFKVGPLELAHLPYRKGTYEDYVGRRWLEKHGKKQWRKDVTEAVGHLIRALHPDDVVIGGGNAKKLAKLPKKCRLGDNANAFVGGYRMWKDETERPVKRPSTSLRRSHKRRAA